MKWVLFGATGFVGKHLQAELIKSSSNEIYVVSRQKAEKKGVIQTVSYDDDGALTKALEAADVVINLIGEPIAEKKWTPKRKQELLSSRIDAVKKIHSLISKTSVKPRFFISTSALGYYGNVAIDVDESSGVGNDFLAEVCHLWEDEALQMQSKLKIPTAIFRFSIVIGKGGYLDAVTKPFHFFMGGYLGDGQNWFSWIQVEDLSKLIVSCGNKQLTGIFNAVSPTPITHKTLASEIGRVLKRPSWISIPAFFIKLLSGEEMGAFLLANQKISSTKISQLEVVFKYETIGVALEDALQ